MKVLTNKELQSINGGSLSGTIISAIVRGIGIITDIGRAVGTAIRRICSNKMCPV